MKYVYRIVNALLALAVLAVMWFVDLIYIEAGLSITDKAVMYESFSAHEILQIFQGKGDYAFLASIFQNSSGVFKWPEQFNIINARLIAILILVFLIILSVIFIIVFSCVSNKRIPVVISSAFGLLCQIAIIPVFSSIAGEFTGGNINVISSLAGTSILTTLGDALLDIEALELGGIQNGIILLFIALIVWTGIFYLSELGENKAPSKK